MFSLPSALPPPPGDYHAATSYNSDTSTAAFPTLQTVTAPETFRQRGDWGFKRNFPLRSTAKTSTPYLRVKQVDSLEHVTDYASAADHTLSLEKWQEMNIAISLPHNTNMSGEGSSNRIDDALESVFEDKYDFTVIDDAQKLETAGQKRWKFKGPWLANLSEGEFQTYVKKQVRGRRAEFREFLRVKLAPRLSAAARLQAMDQGLDEEVPDMRPEDVKDEQILDFLRSSRNHRNDLYDYVGQFLDLAPLDPRGAQDVRDHMGRLAVNQAKEIDAPNPYAILGPPVTHPSAGLSYLRSNSYLENHPVYGPQRKHKAVKARVMNTKTGITRLGVGGFVSPSPTAHSAFGNVNDNYSFKEHGGSKVWVNVVSAQVSSKGRPLVNVEAAEESRLVQEEMQGEKQLFHQEVDDPVEQAMEVRGPKTSRAFRKNRSWREGGLGPYGLDSLNWPNQSGQSDEDWGAPRGRTQPWK